jgi:RNA polymerase sigma factor (sigma-70 family)
MTRLEFNNCVIQLSRRLYLVAFRFLGNREEAEDAVQDAFIRLWNRKDKLDEYKSIEALAITTVKNICIDQLRKTRMKGIVDAANSIQGYLNEVTPFDQLQNKETSSILIKIIEDLPEIYRDIIKKREIEGLTYEEISKITNQNINTLRVTLSRARALIRDEFNRYNYEKGRDKQVARKIL